VRKPVPLLLLAALALSIAGAARAGDQKCSMSAASMDKSCAAACAGAQTFGAAVTVKKATPVAKLAKNPAKMAGKKVRIEGTVKEVCQGRGCWIEVEADGASFLARSLDESVLVPKDCKGKKVVVQGTVKALPAVAKAEEPAPGEAPHECPKPAWVLATEGVELR
jgi:hypothetical protein